MFQDCDQLFRFRQMENAALGARSRGTTVSSFILYTNKHGYISSNFYPGSAVWFHVTNHHIKCCHFRRNTLPSTYWFQIKRQYFHSSISVCLFCVSQPHKHSHPLRKVHPYAHTHLLFSPRSLILY